MSRTLVAFLADRPEAELHEMKESVQEARQRLRQEESRLKVEESLIDEALARKTPSVVASDDTGQRRKLTRAQVLKIITDHAKPVTSGEAIKLVQFVHPSASDGSIRAHLARLQREDAIVQTGRHWTATEDVWDDEDEDEASDPNFPDAAMVGTTSANGHDPEAGDRETGFR